MTPKWANVMGPDRTDDAWLCAIMTLRRMARDPDTYCLCESAFSWYGDGHTQDCPVQMAQVALDAAGVEDAQALPVGTRILSLRGERDGNGTANPQAIGVVTDVLGDLGWPQGWAYEVLFKMDKQAENPDNPQARGVWVTLDEGDGLGDPSRYLILDPAMPARWQERAEVPTRVGPCAATEDGEGEPCSACARGDPPGGNVDLCCLRCGHRSCEWGA